MDILFEKKQRIKKHFNKKHGESPEFSTDIIVLTPEEQELVDIFFDRIRKRSPEALKNITHRLQALKQLALNIAKFPSLYQTQHISSEVRTSETLIQSLLTHRNGDKMLYLPSKAILGKGFLVAKYHIFAAICKMSYQDGFDKKERLLFRKTTLHLMFTIMAEDVYLSLLEDTEISTQARRNIASAIITLWEHRSDPNIARLAPILDSVWAARDTLAPAFGTLAGTSELLLLTIGLDENWRRFIAERTGSFDVMKALEEFLFGLSYEQITMLRIKLRDLKINAVTREEAFELLNEPLEEDAEYDPRKFYLLYTIRRDNARARYRMNLQGPHKTLEDHFMSFILEQQSVLTAEQTSQ